MEIEEDCYCKPCKKKKFIVTRRVKILLAPLLVFWFHAADKNFIPLSFTSTYFQLLFPICFSDFWILLYQYQMQICFKILSCFFTYFFYSNRKWFYPTSSEGRKVPIYRPKKIKMPLMRRQKHSMFILHTFPWSEATIL